MAHIEVEASVRTHRKFLQVGPAASWLWLCGVGYCQDGLTDGFIPYEALPYLGVKSPDALKCKLVAVGLWDQVPGGWKVHDYEKHNRTAAEIADLKERRGKGGAKGGRPPRETIGKTLKVSPEVNHSENPSQIRSDQINSATATDQRLDVAFRTFQGLYPAHRRKGGRLVEEQFLCEVHKAGSSQALEDALQNHLASEQWADSKLIPGMDTWLSEERWRQRLPAKGTAVGRADTRPAWAQRARPLQ